MPEPGAAEDYRLQDPKRAACSAITGYLYQAAWTVQRWLELAEGEVLLCEGDEDLDRRLRGDPQAGLSEQVKHFQKREPRDFRDILANFVRGYVVLRQDGSERRYLLTASCTPLSTRPWDDLLPLWGDDGQREASDQWGRQGAPSDLIDGLAWLGEPGSERWGAFVAAVAWNFGAPDPKAAMEAALRRVVGTRYSRKRNQPAQYLDVLGERVSLLVLRQLPVYQQFEQDLRAALQDHC